MNVLVLGIGNVLLMDEGVGVKAVEELERKFAFPDGVELLDGGTSGMELLSAIANRDYLIIIDAVKSGQPPGTVVRFEGSEVPSVFRTRISPHQLGLSDLLAALILIDELPDKLVLFGVEPGEIETGFNFSEEVEANFEKLLNAVVDELHVIGMTPIPAENPQGKTASLWAHG